MFGKPRLALAGLLLLALGLRLLVWNGPLHQLANDEIEYVTVARDLLAGRGWELYTHFHWLRAPLYPLFLAASLWLAGGDLHLAALPNILLSSATVLLAYLLAASLFQRRVALLAALFTTLLWTLVTFASLYMAETLFTFLFTGSLLLLIRARPDMPLRRRTLLLALAGLGFGLATLTRSVTVAFLPIVLLWLWLRLPGAAPGWRGWLPTRQRLTSLIFLLLVVLTILPWTIRNTLAYGEPILVETGLSFNMWAFNEPRESQTEIYRTLEKIPNPVDRAAFATAKGMERLREDPGILLRKLEPNWLTLWRVKPIEDRFVVESYYNDIGLPLFSAALLFDDLLYLIILLGAIVGIFTLRPSDQRWWASPHTLLILWMLYIVGSIVMTHGEGRYRHFLFPVLIPYAAWGLLQAATFLRDRPRIQHRRRVVAILSLWLLLGGTVLTSYPWRWAQENLARGWYTMVGDLASAQGDDLGAYAAYEQALDARETPDAFLKLGDAARRLGRTEQALKLYREAEERSDDYVAVYARLGDLLREEGQLDDARTAFAKAYATQLTDWSWRHFDPQQSPNLTISAETADDLPTTIDVGNGLDYGFISGVYGPEEQQASSARWSNGQARFRLAVPPNTGDSLIITLRLAAPHPDMQPVSAQICAAERCFPLLLSPTWQTYRVSLPGAQQSWIELDLRSPTFTADDGRTLGVLIDTISLEPSS